MASIPELKQNYPEFDDLKKVIDENKLPKVTATDNGKVLQVDNGKWVLATPSVGPTPILPPEYEELEYIESSGTQWINTGLLLGNSYFIDIKVDHIRETTTTSYLLGSDNSKDLVYTLSGGTYFIGAMTLSTNSFSSAGRLPDAIVADESYYISVRSSETTCRGVVAGDENYYFYISVTNAPDITRMHTVGLFANNTDEGAKNFIIARLYHMTIKDFTKKTITKFVPALRKSDNVVGLYDTITKTFFTNAGTGAFTGGTKE